MVREDQILPGAPFKSETTNKHKIDFRKDPGIEGFE
jgi:hypothetical protein